MERMIVDVLACWFSGQARSFPWRDNRSPYAVLVSEIMLQQTRSSVVVPYFQRWMTRFPDFSSLSRSSEEEVVKCWEGLGYYARARRLRLAAQQVMTEFQGELPDDLQKLLSIVGVGRYTAGAVLSFAFGKRSAALDGNAMRVLARYYGITEPVDKARIQNLLWTRAEALLPEEGAPLVVEALIELGATLCGRMAHCSSCPLRGGCMAHREGTEQTIPLLSRPPPSRILHRVVALWVHQGEVAVSRAPQKGLMQGLLSFPYREVAGELEDSLSVLLEWVRELQIQPEHVEAWHSLRHSFTRYKAILYPFLLRGAQKPQGSDLDWMALDALESYSWPSGHRELVRRLASQSLRYL